MDLTCKKVTCTNLQRLLEKMVSSLLWRRWLLLFRDSFNHSYAAMVYQVDQPRGNGRMFSHTVIMYSNSVHVFLQKGLQES